MSVKPKRNTWDQGEKFFPFACPITIFPPAYHRTITVGRKLLGRKKECAFGILAFQNKGFSFILPDSDDDEKETAVYFGCQVGERQRTTVSTTAFIAPEGQWYCRQTLGEEGDCGFLRRNMDKLL